MDPATKTSNPPTPDKSSVRLRWSLAAVAALVVATGVIAGVVRVEFASHFLARHALVQVTFYDSVTGNEVAPHPTGLLPFALQRQLGQQANIFSAPPLLLPAILQSLLAWLCVWVALGITGWRRREKGDTARGG